uniref:Serine carboxypeptidase S28 family protein n=1 Tax=Setaria digitata TaxID=48799 RepID=A0A915Q868_9BILA
MDDLIVQKYSVMGNERDKNETLIELKEAYSQVETDWISQRIDHFKQTDKREYYQRFMYNMEFYNDSGLAFLLIGGEGKISKSWIGYPRFPLLIWAKKYGAACFLLEHRFFGKSQPFNNISVESYKYLTIDQVLADTKSFIIEANEIFFPNITKPRWILFGSSYSGALATWFRATNENLTTAAIVSSGVVQAKVDQYYYLKNVEDKLEKENPKCPEAVRLGMEEIIGKIYTLDGRKELAKAFKACEAFPEPPTSKIARRSWLWLSCTQIGFMSTTNYGKSIFGSSVPLDFYIDQCMDIFGDKYDAEQVHNGVHKTLRKYGGNLYYNGTRTVFVNGSNDPWKTACFLNLNDTMREVYSVMVEGGSHCTDTHAVDRSDSQSLRNVRAFVKTKLEMFIRNLYNH